MAQNLKMFFTVQILSNEVFSEMSQKSMDIDKGGHYIMYFHII